MSVKSLADERDGHRTITQALGYVLQGGRFLAKTAQEHLFHQEGIGLDPREPDQENDRTGATGQPGRFRIEEQALSQLKVPPRRIATQLHQTIAIERVQHAQRHAAVHVIETVAHTAEEAATALIRKILAGGQPRGRTRMQACQPCAELLGDAALGGSIEATPQLRAEIRHRNKPASSVRASSLPRSP